MMKNQMISGVVLAALFGMMTGCSTVTSVHPVGASLQSDLSEALTGDWIGSDGNRLQIHCSPDGKVDYAVTEWKEDEGRFVLETGSGILRALDDLAVFNHKETEGSDEGSEYLFVLLHVGDGEIVGWSPEVDEFEALVEGGTLAGKISRDQQSTSVVLTGSSEEITAVLLDKDLSELFDWSDPALVLVKQ